MPIREYRVANEASGCALCRNPFERVESIRSEVLKVCPRCGAPLCRVYTPPQISHPAKLDDRARRAGFHKLKKVGKGEYHKEY